MDDGTHGIFVPIGDVLSRIEDKVTKISDRLDGKADQLRVVEAERRITDLERDSVSKDAVTAAVESIRTNRGRLWLTIGLAAFAQLINIALFVAALLLKGN